LQADDDIAAAGPDLLGTSEAGPTAIRGGALRIGGYIGGLVLALASAPLLTRHLGVTDFGRYVTVLSLITIVALITDAGLTVVGVREYAIRDAAGKRRLMENLLAIRLLVASTGVLVAIGFAAVAGYPSTLIAGTALAGAGLILTVAQVTYTVPLISELRLGLVTIADLLRQATTMLFIVGFVVAGATLIDFFALYIPVGLIVFVFTVIVVRRTMRIRPRLDRAEARYLLKETGPAAAASLLLSLFYRGAVITMSLAATATQTGYFSVSFRVIETLIAIPPLITGAAFPILARAAETDSDRLVYALRRMFEVAVILGGWFAISIVLGAGTAIDVIGGPDFAPAIPVLRLQGVAMSVSFLIATWSGALWVIGARRPLILANLGGLAGAVTLVALLGSSSMGAKGAALAMVICEVTLAIALGLAVVRARPELRFAPGVVVKVLVAGGATLALWYLPVPDWVKVIVGTGLYFGLLIVMRAIPPDVREALLTRRRAADSA
jgi:O-antigen/teichoic acid export membrane protein